MISTRTTVGSIGILAHHQPILAMLDPTELRLYRSESGIVRFAPGRGDLQTAGHRALLLLEEAVPPEDLDTAQLRDRLQSAEQSLSQTDEGSEDRRKWERDVRR